WWLIGIAMCTGAAGYAVGWTRGWKRGRIGAAGQWLVVARWLDVHGLIAVPKGADFRPRQKDRA
ncbi:hypothetical protein, partial [Thiohalomonas denitrificans]|uniref:hypothetical protein n=1 Tax=Thiohalomonas denitrificans TaxID=415747 RepID=UPI0026F18CD8